MKKFLRVIWTPAEETLWKFSCLCRKECSLSWCTQKNYIPRDVLVIVQYIILKRTYRIKLKPSKLASSEQFEPISLVKIKKFIKFPTEKGTPIISPNFDFESKSTYTVGKISILRLRKYSSTNMPDFKYILYYLCLYLSTFFKIIVVVRKYFF